MTTSDIAPAEDSAQGLSVSPTPRGTRSRFIPQKTRTIFGLAYVALLVALSIQTQQFPSFDYNGAWFWAGALLLILLSTLVEPIFPTPGDAIANAAALILATIAFPAARATGPEASAEVVLGVKSALVVIAMIPLVAGLVVIGAKREPPRVHIEKPWERFLRRLTTSVGSARVMYSAAFLASSLAVMHESVGDLVIFWVTWLVIIIGRPLEWIYLNWPRRDVEAIGDQVVVVGLRDPGLVELESIQSIELGALITTENATLEVVDHSRSEVGTWALAVLAEGELPGMGSSAVVVGKAGVPALGFIDSGTDLSGISFTVGPDSTPLNYGDLVTAEIQGKTVLYQVVEAEINASKVETNVSHSQIQVKATKLGTWDEESERFTSVGWLPRAGAAVRQLPMAEPAVRVDAIGHVPGTTFSIRADLNTLVTHGSAILGVLGSGKSTYAKELVRRIVKSGCKVMVIDTTPEYAEDLDDLVARLPESIAARINAAIESRANYKDKTKELGGNRREFAQEISRDVKTFLNSTDSVLVYDITKFKVTKQVTGTDYKTGDAGLDECTLPEITAIISREILALMRDKRSDVARLCVVLEEGHYLVPEFSSVSAKDDEKAVVQTAKVFLQGRKFGLGPLLVTQRTANVSKSLLTQANTTFCFRAHDDTTAGFLRERAGPMHIKALAKLEDRRMLAFGRGISCEDPLFLAVNEYSTIVSLLTRDENQIEMSFTATPAESTEGAQPPPREVPAEAPPDSEVPREESQRPDPLERQQPLEHDGVADAHPLIAGWDEVLSAVQAKSRRIHALLRGASVSSVDGALHIVVSSDFHATALNEPGNSEVVRACIKEVLDIDVEPVFLLPGT
jgi:uncharacterized protein